ncbi:MAG: hypothetical protein WCZ02_09885, partial [Lysobacterales bacterium]
MTAHRAAQALLRPLAVVNPYAKELTFASDRVRLRRDHVKYLTLIEAIALLHQQQRPVRSLDVDGGRVEYIEVTPADIALANRLAHAVLGRSLDALPPQTRRVLAALEAWVREQAGPAADAPTRAAVRFTRRQVRNHRGEETFVSYPQQTIAAYNSTGAGVTTQYDALGRPTSRAASSELGVLTTTHAYLSGFQTRITNPRNHATLYSFQAFDQPDAAAATSIQQPLGITTTLSRDRWSKPTAMTRSGSWSGGHQSLTRRFVYDSHQRLCKTIEPETGATVQQWDADNNLAWTALGQTLTSATDCQHASVPSGQRTTHSHDARNRLIALNPPSGTPAITFNWRPDGRLAGTLTDGSTSRRQRTQPNAIQALVVFQNHELLLPLRQGHFQFDAIAVGVDPGRQRLQAVAGQVVAAQGSLVANWIVAGRDPV